MVTVSIPKERLCFGPNASLAFHQAGWPGKPVPEVTQWMVNMYPEEIRNWINDRGGVAKMTVETFWTLPATELWKMGYRRCENYYENPAQ
jgi:hypothetical protein